MGSKIAENVQASASNQYSAFLTWFLQQKRPYSVIFGSVWPSIRPWTPFYQSLLRPVSLHTISCRSSNKNQRNCSDSTCLLLGSKIMVIVWIVQPSMWIYGFNCILCRSCESTLRAETKQVLKLHEKNIKCMMFWTICLLCSLVLRN